MAQYQYRAPQRNVSRWARSFVFPSGNISRCPCSFVFRPGNVSHTPRRFVFPSGNISHTSRSFVFAPGNVSGTLAASFLDREMFPDASPSRNETGKRFRHPSTFCFCTRKSFRHPSQLCFSIGKCFPPEKHDGFRQRNSLYHFSVVELH